MQITPLAARPDQFIEFYLAERYRVSEGDARPSLAPETVVVGPQSRTGVRLHMHGEIDVFTIRFQPTAFHRLFGVPMPEIVDQGLAAGDLLGRHVVDLENAVRRAPDFPARVAAAEQWLAGHVDRAPAATGVDRAARLLVAAHGQVRIAELAARSGLGARHFQRRFIQQVGVGAKFYARTLRLEHALAARAADPTRHWTAIVHAAGYADQAHFIRECRALAGSPPRALALPAPGESEMFNSAAR